MNSCGDPNPGSNASNGRVCIGMMTYNEASTVRQALASLLGQTFPDFTLLVSDDASTDGTTTCIAELATQDPRIVFWSNPSRLGMVENYRFVFSRRPQSCVYFAWASGHDAYEPQWLATLVGLLEARTDAVLAFCPPKLIDAEGAPSSNQTQFFDPHADGSDLINRLRNVLKARGFGSMIYGLFRAAHIKLLGGGLPSILLPDQALLWRIACYGPIIYAPQSLYIRRKTRTTFGYFGLTGRQRRNLFVKAAWYHKLPPFIANPFYFLFAPLPELYGGHFTKTIPVRFLMVHALIRLNLSKITRDLKKRLRKLYG